MFNRRLFFLFPDAEHAGRAVADLGEAGVPRRAIHTVAADPARLEGLPNPRSPEQADEAWRIERQAWRLNLGVFFAALAALVVAAVTGSAWAMALALVVMAGTFLAGAWFALRVPDAHLDEFREALTHGEVLLMVDVAPPRVREIESLVHRRHPEMAEAGVGWTPA